MATLEESRLIGRGNEKTEIIKLVADKDVQQFRVISLWGMGGIGKTTLVRDIYQSEDISGTFEERACVTVMRPFNCDELVKSLTWQFRDKVGMTELATYLEGKRYLLVLDDVLYTSDWDAIIKHFPKAKASCIIVTTREENVAKHCSEDERNMRKLDSLNNKYARILFTKKVFKKTINLENQYPELVEQAELILRKCNGLPLAIVTIGGFLANQPKTALEWRKLNEHISAELEMNPELETIRSVLVRSYDGLPYHLKSCFLYMPIFPEDRRVRRGRLVRRWTAEGYSREVRGKSTEEIADGYFMELISRSMILPSQGSIYSTKGIVSCQVHDLMREIGISKSMEENLVFSLEEGCSSNSQATMRHLVINGNWKGEKDEFESIVDMSRVRSVTVFGEWKSFFISDKMSLLRVLDLEDTTGLRDHHVKHIGKLLHLRYLSLRGCDAIYHLPDSLGNLRELVTLDVRGTKIIKLPTSIVNLQKLSYLRSGRMPYNEKGSYEESVGDVPKLFDNRPCILFLMTGIACCFRSAPELLYDDIDLNCHDACTALCCNIFPSIKMHLDRHGVLVQRGMRKLKALHTLGVVNIARRGKDVLNDIKGLIQLRKLGVTGVNKENGKELCLAIVGLRRMESLSIRSEGQPGLSGCLDGTFLFPENLQTLKLYGHLVKLPEWISGLKNLVKLKLRSCKLSEHHAAIQVLGSLPNLASLHLLENSFEGEEVHLNFCRGMFQSLVVLELKFGDMLESVKFEEGAAPKVELLKLYIFTFGDSTVLGITNLSALKEVVLKCAYISGSGHDNMRYELAVHPNRPVLKS